jgi:phytoene dehydrogenase-like protein
MARVVVVGGGLGGLASAARLAKLGHEVTLLERADGVGGALRAETGDGYTWEVGGLTTLPAVLRDLFRKTGRPLEHEVGDLEPLPVLAEHRFGDGTVLALPGGSRAAQRRAWDALGSGLGDRWNAWVESFADDWEAVRRGYAEVPWDRADRGPGTTGVRRRLDARGSLRRRLRDDLADRRQRQVAALGPVLDGHDLRDVPAWYGLESYLEQRTGVWRLPGGPGAIARALTARLATRGVEVVTGAAARDVVVRGGQVAGVVSDGGHHDADVVVCAVDPRRLPALAPAVARTAPVPPPAVTHLGLAGEVPDLPHQVVLHGDPLLVVRTGGTAPEGHHAWTVLARGRAVDDVPTALARRGLDVRDRVVHRRDRSPDELVEAWGGSPLGVRWSGRRTVRRRLGPDTPLPGVYAAGAHATPGSGIPFTGLSAALVAQRVGPA